MLKAIHAQENRDAADRKAQAIVEDLRAARMNTAADLVERSVHETLTYYAFEGLSQAVQVPRPALTKAKECRRWLRPERKLIRLPALVLRRSIGRADHRCLSQRNDEQHFAVLGCYLD